MLIVENLQVKSGSSTLVKNINFTVKTGERVALIGESGCGKSLTALALFGLLPLGCFVEGQIMLGDIPLLPQSTKKLQQLRGKELVLLPQSGTEFLTPVRTVEQQLEETLARLGLGRVQRRIRLPQLLEQAGLLEPKEVLKKYPFELSGGMAQRVLLAMALAASPQLLVADEPTRGLDSENTALFLNHMRETFQNSAILIITHSMEVALQCHRILLMKEGELIETHTPEQLLQATDSISQRYLRLL